MFAGTQVARPLVYNEARRLLEVQNRRSGRIGSLPL